MSDVSFVAFGNDEPEKLSWARVGDEIISAICGHRHVLKQGELVNDDGRRVPSALLLYYLCGSHTYLAALDGKLLFGHQMAGE